MINQYERLEIEKSAAGNRAMLSTRGHRRNDTPPTRCPLCSRTGHSALKCREFQITRREKKPIGYKSDGEHDGNGGGGGGGCGREGGNRGGSKNRREGRGNVRTNFQTGSLVATSVRLALAARGAPRERKEMSTGWQKAMLPKI